MSQLIWVHTMRKLFSCVLQPVCDFFFLNFFCFCVFVVCTGVLVIWTQHASWDKINSSCSPKHDNDGMDNCTPNTVNYVLASIISIFLYRSITGLISGRRFGYLAGILQFLDVFIFYQIYCQWINYRKNLRRNLYQCRWLRQMEFIFQSGPQAVIQLMYLLRVTNNVCFY